ncbi:MAG TPA: hypothetical protein VFI08_00885 [Spirochaetia bacterium]|nr:hypothetical protein [Spirochaetia bacterium]
MRRRAMVSAGIMVMSAVVACASGASEDAPDPAGVTVVDIRSAVVPVLALAGPVAEALFESPVAAEFPWDEVPRTHLCQERDGSTLYAWVEGDGWMPADGDARIVVRVPPGASLLVQTRSAPVRMEGLAGVRCRLRTVSGAITGSRVRLSGSSEFISESGSVEIGMSAGIEDYGFDLRSVSGTITVGRIRTERGLLMGFGRTRVTARTGTGSLSFLSDTDAMAAPRQPAPVRSLLSGALLSP